MEEPVEYTHQGYINSGESTLSGWGGGGEAK